MLKKIKDMPVPNEYELVDTIGRGSYAVVHLVRHKEFGYCRALRVSHPIDVKEIVKKTDIYQKYMWEYKTMLHLGNNCHPGIINAYKLDTFIDPKDSKKYVYIETDYVEGDTVWKCLRDNNNFISSEEVIHLALQISDALAYCHGEDSGSHIKKIKVIHNDIKPDNIMRRKDGKYVLIDFSAAHTLIDGGIFPTDEIGNRSEEAKKYVAPEVLEKIQNQGENEEKSVAFNERTDIYSFGVVLYQCLTGKLPFYSNEQQLSFRDIIEQRKASFEKYYIKKKNRSYVGDFHECDCPVWLYEVILKCLKREPDKRYANGKELFEDIKEKNNAYNEQPTRKLKNECDILRKELNAVESPKIRKWKVFSVTILLLFFVACVGLLCQFYQKSTMGEVYAEDTFVDSLKQQIRQLQQENSQLNNLLIDNSDEKVNKLLEQIDNLKNENATLKGSFRCDGKTAQQWRDDYNTLSATNKCDGKTARQWRDEYNTLKTSSKCEGKTAQQWRDDYNTLSATNKCDGKTARQWRDEYNTLKTNSKCEGKTAQQWRDDYNTLNANSKYKNKTAYEWYQKVYYNEHDAEYWYKSRLYEGHDAKYWFEFHYAPK